MCVHDFYAHPMCAGTCGNQKRVLGSLELLDLQMVVNNPMRVLEPNSGPLKAQSVSVAAKPSP